jgi:hypothetical protein
MREYGPGNPLVFSHIPKTAGTSLGALLHRTLQPTVFVGGLDRSLFGGYSDLSTIKGPARDTIVRGPEDLPADATLIAAHIAPGTTMPRYPGADHVTFLRTPEVRLLSQWIHSRSLSEFDLRHWGPAADAFRVSRLPLQQYLQHRPTAPLTDNTITRFLTWPNDLLPDADFIDEAHDEKLVAAATDRLDAFAHVGLVENRSFIDDFGAWLGRDLPDTRLNERTTMPARRRPDLHRELAAGTLELLRHRSRIDRQVWEHVARRVLPDADPAATMAQALQTSIERYATLLSGPPTRSRPVRRAAELAYDAAYRISPRLVAR